MNVHVDTLKRQITQSYSKRSANYRYTQDGGIHPTP